MAHFLRAKQSGISNDFSSSVSSDRFMIDEVTRFGVGSQVSQLAYDPIQSLVAVGTNSTSFGPGQIYVFGQGRVAATFFTPRRGSVRSLRFCADKLICADDKNELTLFSLIDKKQIAAYAPPGNLTCLECDPTLDYIMIGLQTGEIVAYDMEKRGLAPFRLPNLLAQMAPGGRPSPVISLEFHPRDIGMLLIGYLDGAVIYSFKQNQAIKSFRYVVERGAPGGDSDPATVSRERHPRLTHAIWHPTGTFILTVHEDSSLVFWDPKDGRVVQARTLTETGVNRVGRSASLEKDPKTPITKVAWCANKDPDLTAILIAGGHSRSNPSQGLTLLELARTPNYTTSSWQILSAHFENPSNQRILPIPPNSDVVNFCLVPRSSPWFAGAHDPIAILSVLSSGELVTSSFPSGYPISPTNQLHVSLSFVHPFVTLIRQVSVDRRKWLSMTENRSSGPPLLRGGVEGMFAPRRFEERNIVVVAHGDGTVRIWDAGRDDEMENSTVLQADVTRAAGRDAQISEVSLSGLSGELAVGLKTGEVVVFRWGTNTSGSGDRGPPPLGSNTPHGLTDVRSRKDTSLTEGLHPFTLLDQGDGPVTALKISDIGFVAAGFESGSVVVIDLRGPAVILESRLADTTGHHSGSKGKVGRSLSMHHAKEEWPTTFEFSVMTLDGDAYSSILLHAGTNTGRVLTYKILPAQGGRYTVEFAGATQMDNRILYIHPVNSASGSPASASPGVVASLRDGRKFDGALLVVTPTEGRIFKPAASKGAHRSWDNAFCDNAKVAQCRGEGYALVGLFGDGTTRCFSIPGLKEIGSINISQTLDTKRFANAALSSTGEIMGWKGPSEIAILNVWGTGQKFGPSKDNLYTPEARIPPRPTISNFQWVSGTQYMTPSDLDVIIGGPDRPPSKRMLDQAMSDEQARREGNSTRSGSAAAQQDEGYWAYMQRQITERTEKLGTMSESIDALEANSSQWAEDVNKFLSRQKKNMITGAIKSKFGI